MSAGLEPTAAEQRLIDAAAKGEIADYRVGDEEADDPANGEKWGDERTLRAEIIYALCVGTRPEWKVHPKGVWAWGARIVGDLDFEAATLRVPLGLVYCLIDEPITLRDARTRILNFSGSHCNGISADRLAVEGSVILRNGFTAKGEVRLLGANIGGDLDCSGARFENPGKLALNADRLVTKGGVFLSGGFSAEGEVRLLGADIGGTFDCVGARFENPGGIALGADRLVTKGAVFLSAGFSAVGGVRLHSANIGRSFECHGARFENPGGYALVANRLVTKGSVFLCERVTDNGERQPFTAKGEVNLVGADIGGNLDCVGAQLENPGGSALNADGLVTKGAVFLRNGFVAKGEVRLAGADIGIDLSCIRARFENPDGDALTAERMRVGSALMWRQFIEPPKGGVNFGHARVGQLVDDGKSWPAPGNLLLDGFVYGAIAGDAPRTASERLPWLRLQPKGPVRPQPYEQLVRVLREMGYEKEAREIAIAKQRAIRKSDETGWLRSLWMGFLGVTIVYGHNPWRALIFMALFLVLGAVVFSLAHDRQIMVPSQAQASDPGPYISCTKSYPCLQPIVYSLDAFLPIVDLHQEKYWLPDVRKNYGWLYQAYLWLHISFGWILTTVLVAGLTGLVKKD